MLSAICVGEFLDVGKAEELNAVVPAEGRTLVRPPGVEAEPGGVAFAGVDREEPVTVGAGLVVDAVGGVGHEVHAVVACEPEALAGLLPVQWPGSGGAADLLQRLLDSFQAK